LAKSLRSRTQKKRINMIAKLYAAQKKTNK